MNANLIAQLTGVTLTGTDTQVVISSPSKEEIKEILEAVFGNENPSKQ
ncbi:MAG: hypothetical protein ACM3ZQ_04055 [Bacillota bacterium]